jgi:hypothetical protein
MTVTTIQNKYTEYSVSLYYSILKCFIKNVEYNGEMYHTIFDNMYTPGGRLYIGKYSEIISNKYIDELYFNEPCHILQYMCSKLCSCHRDKGHIKIYQYDRDMNVVNIFDSITIASHTLKIDPGSVFRCCKEHIVLNNTILRFDPSRSLKEILEEF